MSKWIIVVFSVFISISVMGQSHKSYYDKIVIKYVDLELETPMFVNCDSFEKYFQYDSLIVTDRKLFQKLENGLLNSKTPKDKYHVNTRIKIICFKGNNIIESYCLNEVGLSSKSGVFTVSQELLADIEKIMATEKRHKKLK